MSYKPGARALLIEACQDLLGEYEGTLGGDDPFAWVRLLNAEVDSLCRGTYCLHAAFTDDVTAGQSDYCAPPVFRITAVLFTDSHGAQTRLHETSRAQMDRMYPSWSGGGWRANPTPGTPTLYVSAGENRVTLYPTPSDDIPQGLTVEGYAAPGDAWRPDPDAPDDPLSAICPLPERDWETVIHGAVLRRTQQFPTPENAARYPMVQQDYQRGRGKMERESATLTQDRR